MLLLSVGLVSCSGSKELSKSGFTDSSVPPSDVTASIPDYQSRLLTVKGKGRAIVSEPGNTERVTVTFSSDTAKSLVTIRNGIGIKGGEMLTDGDTLLIYNKVDKRARKVAIKSGNINRINKLASLNILKMIHYPINAENVQRVQENKSLYKIRLSSGTYVLVDKESGFIRQVTPPANSALPYSKITYDSYASVEGFILPRRISIFGANKQSKVSLQLTELDLNPQLNQLTLNIPDDIPIYYQ
ncbi:DUF4292 domain-containing protein [Fodinibius salinus]|uniref:DUF4292 domain-containing protein n=1 Tax=Fodinibius salinus TaxID=860790 RepID=UPI001B85B93C|nr:DUF4292 domain-containing protein [Fodinibius salinus]